MTANATTPAFDQAIKNIDAAIQQLHDGKNLTDAQLRSALKGGIGAYANAWQAQTSGRAPTGYLFNQIIALVANAAYIERHKTKAETTTTTQIVDYTGKTVISRLGRGALHKFARHVAEESAKPGLSVAQKKAIYNLDEKIRLQLSQFGSSNRGNRATQKRPLPRRPFVPTEHDQPVFI